MKVKKNNNDGSKRFIQCPKCGYEIPLTSTRIRKLLPIEAYVRYMRAQRESEQIESRGNAAFIAEASKRGWSVFGFVTPDIGIRYIIAKEYGAVMVRLRNATMMGDGRYHVTVGRFLEGPLGIIVYHFDDINTFFLIPSVKFWEIPRFKPRKPEVFAHGNYSDILSYKKAREVMGEYENENGWALLERLTTPEGISKAVKSFIDKQRQEKV